MFDYTYGEIQNIYEENIVKTQKTFQDTVNTFEFYLKRKVSDAIKLGQIKKGQENVDSCPYYVIKTIFPNYIFSEATGKSYNLTPEHIQYWQDTSCKALNVRLHIRKKSTECYNIIVIFYANAYEWADDNANVDFD